jgi:hypothetical protein
MAEGRGRDSSVGTATGYGQDGPRERFFAHVQTGTGYHPAFCIMGTGSFPGVKRSGRGADHPSPSSAEVENEYSYITTPPMGPSGPVTGYLFTWLRVLESPVI